MPMRPRAHSALAAVATVAAVLLATGCGGGGPSDPGTGTPPPGPPAPPSAPTTIPPGPYVPGTAYAGRNGYVEYVAGDAPLIVAAPHGGTTTPAELPARTCGTTARDLGTLELARAIQAAVLARTGRRPHVVLLHLHRSRLDANRDSTEATCGDPLALTAWREWHAFLGIARSAVVRDHGRGWFLDLHGHAHPVARLELGYLLSDDALALGDPALDAGGGYERSSSIRTLSEQDAGTTFAALLRGPASLGALYAAEGFPAVPSPASPGPGGEPYFDGGYNTARYGCRDGGAVCGVQLEAHYTGVRDTPESRARFAEATARVLERFLAERWGLVLSAPPRP
jgi:hypothetical protein